MAEAALAHFIGCGQFPGLFNEHTEAGRQWAEERQALKALLSAEEFRSARGSILNAHYTAPQIVNAMWDIARRLGFRRGRVLEPSVGSGNFFALMPRDIRKHSPIVGIGLDKTTGQIAQLLYPNADIQIKGFEEYAVSDDFFDLVISNFPFGDYGIADSAAYMSPLQARGKDVDARTDVFSLGAVIYEMLSGRAPFGGETAADIIGALIHKEPQPLSTLLPNTPAELQHIVSKALRKDRDERYQTVKSLLVDLKTLKQELDFSAKLERSVSPDSKGAGFLCT